MKKKLLIIITSIVLIGIICIWFLVQNKSAEQVIVDNLNEAVSNYTDMNIKDDKLYSLKVSDTQMLVTTYMPEYTFFGVSTDEYTVRPSRIEETLTTENEQDLPICNFDNVLLYDEKSDKFYNVKFKEKGKPVIPNFTEAKELNRTIFELELPNASLVESISLKKNSDSPIVISNKDDVGDILDILEGTKPTTKSGEIGTPIRVENIINVDFISKENVISRLFLYEDKGKYFIEQTDNGVYTISKEDYDLIENYLKGN
ncbi:MAG: DUF5301 domain-containing protein [Lachnospiraceae bacterium]|nr:DUF5301 domain-containing protein [Lachnospiraceae bacterium]